MDGTERGVAARWPEAGGFAEALRGPAGEGPALSKATQARVRARPARDVVTELRLATITGLMLSLRFRRGVTVRRLAREWELSEQRVRELSAEASKRVRARAGDEVAVEVIGELRATFRFASRSARKSGDPEMIRAAVAAGNLLADIVGLKAPRRVGR